MRIAFNHDLGEIDGFRLDRLPVGVAFENNVLFGLPKIAQISMRYVIKCLAPTTATNHRGFGEAILTEET